jgi:uncharacterized membrane protein YqjE
VTDPKPVVNELIDDLRGLAADVVRMVELKKELASEELRQDACSTRRLALWSGTGILAAVAGLPLLLTAVCLLLDDQWGISAAQWALIFSIPLVLGGSLLAIVGWLRFRREFLGLRDSVQELQEDLRWFRDWLR